MSSKRGSAREPDPACCCCTDFPNSRLAGAKSWGRLQMQDFMFSHPTCAAMDARPAGTIGTTQTSGPLDCSTTLGMHLGSLQPLGTGPWPQLLGTILGL